MPVGDERAGPSRPAGDALLLVRHSSRPVAVPGASMAAAKPQAVTKWRARARTPGAFLCWPPP
jgi:hypothetical protein